MTAPAAERRPDPAAWSRKATPLVFLLLAAPSLGQLLLGDLALDVAALRCLIAVLVAVVGVQLLEGLMRGYGAAAADAQVTETPADQPDPIPGRRADDGARAA